MDYKKIGLGLGLFSIGLGLLEVAAPGRLARWLGVDGKTVKTVIGLFGARELLAVAPPPAPVDVPEPQDWLPPCPCCGGHMTIIATFGRWRLPRAPPHPSATTGSTPS